MPVLQWFVAISAPPVAPPIAVGDRVYVALSTGALTAHRLANGAQLWSVELPVEQPLAADDAHVFVASGEAVHALRGDDGAVAWRAATGAITAPPLVHAGWVIVAGGNALSAFRAADGTRVWRRDVGAGARRPFIEGDALFAALGDGRILRLDLQDGMTRWERRLAGAPGEPFVADDRLYVGSGKYFYCLDADDGSVEWEKRIGAEVRGRPAADADRVYFAALDNELRALDRRHGALRWHRGVPFRPSAGPIVLDSTVIVPGPVAELRAFDAASGTAVKGFALAQPIVTAPAVLSGGEPAQLRIAAVTGGLNNEWRLAVFGPAGEPPEGIALEPLTALPGAAIPLGW